MEPFAVRRRARLIPLAVVVGLIAPMLLGDPAAAHETRKVGDYTFVVGWYNEPAFADVPNGPEVTIIKGPREDPVVEDVDLDVEVVFGEEHRTFEVEPAFVVGIFGEPGNYNADTFPTRPGQYSFHFTGTVEGQDVDETFTSGEQTFSDVNDPAEVAFPAADPNNAQLASRLDGTADDVSSARTLGLIGVIVGAAALLTAGLVLFRKRG